MPQYWVTGGPYEISRRAMILDTCVLIARFNPSDEWHDHADGFLAMSDFQWLVPSVVVVEAWGFLVGSRRLREGGRALLAWLNTPGKALVLPRHHEPLTGVADVVSGNPRLDCVDAMVAELADDITAKCDLVPPLRVGTFDVVDYHSIKARKGLRLSVYDVRTLDDESDSS